MGNCFGCFNNNNKKLLDASIKNTKLFSLNGLKTVGKVIDVYDGDTCKIAICLNNSDIFYFNCRLSGIDTPELKEPTKEIAIRSRNKLLDLISDQTIILNNCNLDTKENIREKCYNNKLLLKIECQEFDKYGRLLVKLTTKKGLYINQELINLGLAKPYNGGTKQSF